MPLIVGVMGPGRVLSNEEQKTAYTLGRLIAEQRWVLLTGGRNAGVMDAASRGAKSANGIVVGVLPDADRVSMSEAVDVPIVTGMGNARNMVNILSSDVVVACGVPGAGTTSEVALALKAAKPVVLLKANVETKQFFQWLGGKGVILASDPQQVITCILSM